MNKHNFKHRTFDLIFIKIYRKHVREKMRFIGGRSNGKSMYLTAFMKGYFE